MFDVILVSHGPLSKAMLESAEFICGKQDHVKTFGLYLGDSVDTFRDEVYAAIEESLSRGDLIVLTDIQSGSPFNVTCAAMGSCTFHHITGMNLPMVIELLTSRDFMSASELAGILADIGSMSVVDVNKLLDDFLETDDSE